MNWHKSGTYESTTLMIHEPEFPEGEASDTFTMFLL